MKKKGQPARAEVGTFAPWLTEATADEVDKARDIRERYRAWSSQRRLWLPVGVKKRWLVLDDEPKAVREHNPMMNGTRKGNWYTCIAELDRPADERLKEYAGGCPWDSLVNDYFNAFVSVLVLDPFEVTVEGERFEIPWYRQMWPLKLEGTDWFNDEKRKRKSLVGAVFEGKRLKKSDPVYGKVKLIGYEDIDDEKFSYVSPRSGTLIKPEPVDYAKVLRPWTRAELLKVVQRYEDERAGRAYVKEMSQVPVSAGELTFEPEENEDVPQHRSQPSAYRKQRPARDGHETGRAAEPHDEGPLNEELIF